MPATNATFVQAAQGTGGVGGVTLAAAPTAGNLLVCIATDGATVPSLIGNFTWTNCGQVLANPRTNVGWRIAQAGETAAQQVAASGSGATMPTCAIYEFASPSGWPANPVFGSSVVQNAVSVPGTVTSAALGVCPAGGFAVAFCNSNAAGNTSPTAFTGTSGAGFTINIPSFHAASNGAAGNGMCGYVLNPTLDAGGNFTALTATWSGSTSITGMIAVVGLVTAPVGFTGNWVSSSPTGGSSTVNLPNSPTTGNLLVATGITGGNTPLTANTNWNMIPNNTGAATQSFMAWRYVGSASSGQQTPFVTVPSTIVTVTMAEFASNTPWVMIPVDVWNGMSQAGAGSPPTATSPSITPTLASDFVVLMTYLANKSSSTVSSVAGMTKIGDLVLTPGASVPGPGSLLYQLNVGTSPYSVALNFTGPSSGIGVLVAAFNPAGFSHGSLAQTVGCTLSAAGTVPNRATLSQTCGATLNAAGKVPNRATLNQTVGATISATGVLTTHATLAQTIGCTLVATVKTQSGANASLSQTIGCTLSATGKVAVHATLAQIIGCTLVATGKASAIHASLSQTLGATISAAGILTTHAALNQTVSATIHATAVRTSHATLAQTCPCTISAAAVGPTPSHGTLSQIVSCSLSATGKTTPIHASLAQTVSCSLHATGTAQVIHASLAQTVPCTLSATGGQPLAADVAQVIVEGMSPTSPYYGTVAQVVIEGMSSYQIVPLQVAQVVIEGMSPTIMPYNPQPPEAFAPQ